VIKYDVDTNNNFLLNFYKFCASTRAGFKAFANYAFDWVPTVWGLDMAGCISDFVSNVYCRFHPVIGHEDP
jgi:hypothetical protein